MKKKREYLLSVFFLIGISFFFSCENQLGFIKVEPTTDTLSYVDISFRGVNEDMSTYEDRVTEIRLMAFDSNTGAAVYNAKLMFPNGDFNQLSNPVKLLPGTYDFYFIANETIGGIDFVNALNGVDNVFKFKTDIRFWNLNYNPDFKPTATSGFIMSARYKGIAIPGGYTATNPLHFLPNGTGVQLVRAFAKVELIVRNALNEDNSVHLSNKRITSVQLINLPKKFSVPPIDVPYVTNFPNAEDLIDLTAVNPVTFDYNSEVVGTLVFYIPEFLRGKNESDSGNTSIVISGSGFPTVTIPLDHQNFSDYNQTELRDLNVESFSLKSILRNTDYRVNATLKEHYLELEIEALAWELEQSSIEFSSSMQMAYAPSWNPVPPVIKIPYTTHEGGIYDVATFTFKMSKPAGGMWKATLTNGLDFAFDPSSPTMGVAGVDYSIKIVALKSPASTTRSTEFYLMIDGKEVDPDIYSDGGQIIDGPIGVGKGNRYVIIQSAQ